MGNDRFYEKISERISQSDEYLNLRKSMSRFGCCTTKEKVLLMLGIRASYLKNKPKRKQSLNYY